MVNLILGKEEEEEFRAGYHCYEEMVIKPIILL
jgi:hypothetical protein